MTAGLVLLLLFLQIARGLVFIIEAASHDFGQVIPLVDYLTLQIILGLLDKFLDCWLLVHSMLAPRDECIKRQ